MCHDALQRRAALLQCTADLDQQRTVSLHAGTMAVAVDLDQHVERMPGRGHRACGVERIHDDAQCAPAPPQRQRTVKLRRHHADGIKDVCEARGEKLLGLLQGRDRDAAGTGGLLQAGHLDALRGLDVGAQHHAERRRALLHARDVAHHARLVDERRRRLELSEIQAIP